MQDRRSASKRLIPLVVEVMRKRHYSRATIASYTRWIKQYIRFHNKRHPAELGASEVEEFLSHLAIDRAVSASTQNQALCAIVFLYKSVLRIDLGDFGEFSRPKKTKRLPEVFTPQEISDVFSHLHGTYWLMANLLYGGGLRISELVSLRIKDIDFDLSHIVIRDGKGGKDRHTRLPQPLHQPLIEHLKRVRELHDSDLKRRFGRAPLPFALGRKYPGIDKDWSWQYVFPSTRISPNEISGKLCRHHCAQSTFQREFRKAVKKAGIKKHVSVHNLRHSFATHSLLNGTNIRSVQRMLGHKTVKTTEVYLRVAENMKEIVDLIELLPTSSTDQLKLSKETNVREIEEVKENSSFLTKSIHRFILKFFR